ncbi:methionyl-tRNA formyltransferase [Candidatus Puniceispirillum sp.]|nr:methionyl-tRNA formyltransferase [Candidatus Puniceispirillum sp.]
MKIIIAAKHDRYKIVVKQLFKAGVYVEYCKTPKELNNAINQPLKFDHIFFLHWSWVVPKTVFKKIHCVIFHMTDLPYGRGGSPLQNLIERGHTDTMISAIVCDSAIDSGAVYCRRKLCLGGSAEEILLRGAIIMAEMISEILINKPKAVEQQGAPVYFKRRTPEQSKIDPDASLLKVFDKIRMLDADSYPRAFLEMGDLHFEFKDAKVEGNSIVAKVEIKKIETP